MENGVAIDFNGLVRVVLKLSGLALAVYGAVTLVSYSPMILTASDGVQLLAFMSAPAVFMAAGIFLWLFPAPAANTVIRGDGAGAETRLWADRLIEAGCILIGLWWLIRAVSDLVYNVLDKWARDSSPDYMQGYGGQGDSEFVALMVATGVELVLAVVLIIGSRGVVGVIRSVRRGGLALDDERR